MKNNKKPIGIIIVTLMDLLRLVITWIPTVALMVVAMMPESNEFRQGVESSMGVSIDAEILGIFVGNVLFITVLMIALCVAIFKRKFVLTIVMIVLQILFSLRTSIGLIWAIIMLLIVLIGKKNRQYLKGMV